MPAPAGRARGRHLSRGSAEPQVARSFGWPFRGRWRASWAIGLLTVLLLPIGFVPLLGYAVRATRAAASDPGAGLPSWSLRPTLLADGLWVAAALAVLTAPFAILLVPVAGALGVPALWRSSGTMLQVEAHVAAALVLALPWGLLLLLIMPHATARFAITGRARDLFDFAAAIRNVGRDFAAWNVAVAAIVTAWAIGLACVGLVCAGAVPGIYYAILVSAHATATLHVQGAHPAAR
jgi:hypothetical protein